MPKIILPILALAAMLAAPGRADAQRHQKPPQKPKLVVNIVVSQMRQGWLDRFDANLSDEGFARMAVNGTNYTAAYYNYMQTLTPTSLATVTTGTNPSIHGVVSESWIDYVTGGKVSLAADPLVAGLACDPGKGRYSPANIVMPTLGDKLLEESPQSKVVTIAADPVSAVAMGGLSSQVYWMDDARATWISSTGYMWSLPAWVEKYNDSRPANYYASNSWELTKRAESYLNGYNTIFTNGKSQRIDSFRNGGGAPDCRKLMNSPYGNTLVADFARHAIAGESLGADEHTDLLNICFDASRYVGETYGAGSMEVEDMLYRLDRDLGEFIKAVTAQVGLADVLFVLTSDHGASDAWDGGAAPRDRFNPSQFKTILNSFLAVQFGPGDWVLDYIDRQVYLNHNLIYRSNLSLEEVQNRAATFSLQFRGVSHVLTSTAMRNGYFGDSYGHRMQNGFYPRRAGDLMLNFVPGWIEQRDGARSLSGSMYDYDTHVPLLLFGWRIPSRKVGEPVDMTRLAPSLARIMQISRPAGSDGATLPEIDY